MEIPPLNSWNSSLGRNSSPVGNHCPNQCCRFVMNKKPRIYLDKSPENDKKKTTHKTFKKTQNPTWNVHYWYLHTKMKVIMYFLYRIFNKSSSSLFWNILTVNLQKGKASSKWNVWSNIKKASILPLNGNLRNTSYMKKIPNYEL